MKKIYYALLTLLLAPLGFLLVDLNLAPVHFDYYLGSIDLPLAVLLVVAMIGGMVFALLALTLWVWRERRNCRKVRKEAELLREEVRNLRNIPIKDSH